MIEASRGPAQRLLEGGASGHHTYALPDQRLPPAPAPQYQPAQQHGQSYQPAYSSAQPAYSSPQEYQPTPQQTYSTPPAYQPAYTPQEYQPTYSAPQPAYSTAHQYQPQTYAPDERSYAQPYFESDRQYQPSSQQEPIRIVGRPADGFGQPRYS